MSVQGQKFPSAPPPIHVCFQVAPEDYPRWKEHLTQRDIPLLREVAWPHGQSFYFEDPSGNLLEIANADIWPR